METYEAFINDDELFETARRTPYQIVTGKAVYEKFQTGLDIVVIVNKKRIPITICNRGLLKGKVDFRMLILRTAMIAAPNSPGVNFGWLIKKTDSGYFLY